MSVYHEMSGNSARTLDPMRFADASLDLVDGFLSSSASQHGWRDNHRCLSILVKTMERLVCNALRRAVFGCH